MCCVKDLQFCAKISSSFSQRTEKASVVSMLVCCSLRFLYKNELWTKMNWEYPIPLFMCFSMESSPPTQSAPLSSVLPTSGLPESMTVGECLTFFYLSASYYFALSVSPSLCSDRFFGLCHVIITINAAEQYLCTGTNLTQSNYEAHSINHGLNTLNY